MFTCMYNNSDWLCSGLRKIQSKIRLDEYMVFIAQSAGEKRSIPTNLKVRHCNQFNLLRSWKRLSENLILESSRRRDSHSALLSLSKNRRRFISNSFETGKFSVTEANIACTSSFSLSYGSNLIHIIKCLHRNSLINEWKKMYTLPK